MGNLSKKSTKGFLGTALPISQLKKIKGGQNVQYDEEKKQFIIIQDVADS